VDGALDRYPLFWKVKDPRSDGAHYKNNLIPLSIFTGAEDGELTWDRITPEANRPSVLARMKEIGLLDQVRAIWKREFFYLVMEESAGKNHTADVVQLYNRINSGGKRVESEERAFATLTSIWPGTNAWLQDLFREIHPENVRRDERSLRGRDDMLRRKKERNFGFKLFIRTFLQACAYHLGYSVGSSTFSFDISARPDFQATLAAPENNAELLTIASETRQGVVAIRSALSDLGCDALQTLPDTESLLPVFQLFLRFPAVLTSEAHRPSIRFLVLRLMLAELRTRELLELVKVVNRSDGFQECIDALAKKTSLRGDLKERLKESNSLQDRYVLLLYWLLRRRGARDFSYKNVDTARRAKLDNVEAQLCEKVDPEKQHIVPYSTLKIVLEIEGRGRQGSHVANNIGNLTYISHDLNHYETGLGAEQMDLSLESVENLRAHLLLQDDSNEKDVRDHYSEACEGKRAFESFCKSRRSLISQAFTAWHSDLESAVGKPARVMSRPPLLVSSWEGRVRGLNFSAKLEDRLVQLLREGVKPQEKNDVVIFNAEGFGVGCLRLWETEVWVERPGPKAKELDLLLRNDFPEVERRDDGTKLYRKPMSQKRVGQIVEAMEAMAGIYRAHETG
jgi:hypothetical protein